MFCGTRLRIDEEAGEAFRVDGGEQASKAELEALVAQLDAAMAQLKQAG